MEVQLTPETRNKLAAFAEQSGLDTNEIFEDALVGYLAEAARVRGTLDSRYDDLKSGRVQPIPGEEVYRSLMAKTEARRKQLREQL